jgi:hypothetical protein
MIAQEFDERDSATDSCDGAPKYRQATRMVEVSTRTTARSEPLEQRIDDGDDRSALWLYRRNDYDAHDHMYGNHYNGHPQDGFHSYGWTVSNGVDAEHCYGVQFIHNDHSYEYAYEWSTDHVLVGRFRGGGAYDDKFGSNVPTELRWNEAVGWNEAGSARQSDDCFNYRWRCWETTRDEFSVVSSLRCLCLLSLACIASITELLCMCDYAPVRAMADGSARAVARPCLFYR